MVKSSFNMYLRLALRNLARTKYRSFFIGTMITASVVALLIFKAYTADTLNVLERIATDVHFGHFQVAKRYYWDKSELVESPDELKNKLIHINGISQISYRVSSMALLSTGTSTEGIKLQGIDFKTEKSFKDSLSLLQGQLPQKECCEIILGHLVAKKLNVKIGDTVTALLEADNRALNGLDLQLVGIFASGTEELDKHFGIVNLHVMEKLKLSKKVDLLVLRKTEAVTMEQLHEMIAVRLPSNFIVKSFRELAAHFIKVEKFFKVQNSLIVAILMALIFFALVNTVSMNIYDRTLEVGVFRANGMSVKGIYTIFVLETFVLFIISGGMGCGLAYAIGEGLNFWGIYSEVPGASMPVKIGFLFLIKDVIKILTIVFVTLFFALAIPLINLSRLSIIQCLKR